MREALQRTLARAFDTADIARLRDRAKLHIIVDDTVAYIEAGCPRGTGDIGSGSIGLNLVDNSSIRNQYGSPLAQTGSASTAIDTIPATPPL